MTGKPAPLLRQAFGEQITDHLRDALIVGDLSAGQRLTEGELAEQYGVSRGPIRDALRQLATEHLVEQTRSGTYVIGISEADIRELYLLREAIETLATSLLVERINDDGWRQMQGALDKIFDAADNNDELAFGAADIQFHSLIYELSGHQRLQDVWAQYAPILSGLLQQTIFQRGDLHETAERHRLLLNLLKEGNIPAIDEELKDHLDGSHQKMIAALRRRDAATGATAAG